MLDKDGNLVALADRRYQSNADLGNHRIDVTAKRSLDGGRTWSRQYVVAEGDGTNKVTFGYGDASLARTKSGRLICLMATGANNFFSAEGIKWVTMTTSDDNGMTWSRPSLITDNAFGFQSVFVSSGKGLTTKDGTILFTTNIIKGGQLDCHILRSKDDGQTWELLPEVAFAKADESKMEQLSNGQIFLSVRRQGDRGFNVAANADGTGWGTSWTNGQISGNACNADVLSYGLSADGKNDILIHSYVKSPYRENLTLAISRDSGKTWKDFLNIQKGGAAYSTMQLLPNGDIAVFYEDESYSAGNGYAQTFVIVTKDQIK
jgi:sialidase-1